MEYILEQDNFRGENYIKRMRGNVKEIKYIVYTFSEFILILGKMQPSWMFVLLSIIVVIGSQ